MQNLYLSLKNFGIIRRSLSAMTALRLRPLCWFSSTKSWVFRTHDFCFNLPMILEFPTLQNQNQKWEMKNKKSVISEIWSEIRIQNQNLTYTKSRAWRTQKFFMNTTFLPKKWKPLKKDFGVTPDASSCACSSSVVLAFFIHVRKMRKGWTHYLMSRCFSSLSNTLGQKLNFCP